MKLLSLFFLFCVSYVAHAQEISARYELVKMNDNVNTRYNEVSPVVSPDGKSLYYFVANHPENTYGKDGSQDIWVSSLDDKGQWMKAKHLGAPLIKIDTIKSSTLCRMALCLFEVGEARIRKVFQLSVLAEIGMS